MSELDEKMARLSARQAENKRRSLEDRIHWPPDPTVADFEESGLRCVVLAGPMSRRGYVRVPPGHPYAHAGYDDVPVEVHGGLTFRCLDTDGFSWFGWDDGHNDKLGRSHREETVDLARQLAKLATT